MSLIINRLQDLRQARDDARFQWTQHMKLAEQAEARAQAIEERIDELLSLAAPRSDDKKDGGK